MNNDTTVKKDASGTYSLNGFAALPFALDKKNLQKSAIDDSLRRIIYILIGRAAENIHIYHGV